MLDPHKTEDSDTDSSGDDEVKRLKEFSDDESTAEERWQRRAERTQLRDLALKESSPLPSKPGAKYSGSSSGACRGVSKQFLRQPRQELHLEQTQSFSFAAASTSWKSRWKTSPWVPRWTCGSAQHGVCACRSACAGLGQARMT